MSTLAWTLVTIASRSLQESEGEAVRSDLEELGTGGWRALLEVAGLVVRRAMMLWSNWRPWTAALVFTLPASFLLMGISLMTMRSYRLNYAAGHLSASTIDEVLFELFC